MLKGKDHRPEQEDEGDYLFDHGPERKAEGQVASRTNQLVRAKGLWITCASNC